MAEDDQISDEQKEMLPEFLAESDEHLQVLNAKMLEAETAIKSGTEMSSDDLNKMFRSAHTIKGTASFIGLNKVVNLTHKTETLLQKLRDGEMKLTSDAVDVLFSAFDTLTALLECLKEKGVSDVDIAPDVAKIEAVLSGGTPASVEIKPAAVNPPSQPAAAPQTPVKEKPPINEKYLEQFVMEIDQNIDDLNDLLLKSEGESHNNDVINGIFRIMHTIKGSAGIVNVVELTQLAHKLENILGFFREGTAPLTADVISLLFKGSDLIKVLNDCLKKERRIDLDITDFCATLDGCYGLLTTGGGKSAEPSKGEAGAKDSAAHEMVTDQLCDLKKISSEQKKELAEAVAEDNDVFALGVKIAAELPLKSMKIAILEGRLRKNGKLISINSSVKDVDAATDTVCTGFIYASSLNETDLRGLLALDSVDIIGIERLDVKEFQPETPPPAIAEPKVPDMPEPKKGPVMAETIQEEKKTSAAKPEAAKSTPIEISTIRIDSRKLDTLMTLSGELVIIRAQFARLVNLFQMGLDQLKAVGRSNDKLRSVAENIKKEIRGMAAGGADTSHNIDKVIKTVAQLEEIVVELDKLLAQSGIGDNVHTLDETTSALEKVASNIQSGVMQSRMIPVEGVFTRFKRIVRDIAKDLNKEVELVIEGADTELDKKIVDSLGDPLTHMIRNSVDHGLEDSATREKAGKSRVGTVLLKASHQGNHICIEISDDGKGIDSDKIAQSAINKGILTQDQVDKMSEKDKLNIIFLPGFSTAEKVTGLSGRGVGMDVVKNMITSVNGAVDIETKLGSGTRFLLKIPLTLAIIQALLVKIGEEIYAFPLELVTEIIKVSKNEVYSVDGNVTVKLRDHALSLIDLEEVIRIENKRDKQQDAHKKVVIITDGETNLGVSVDALVGKDEIVIKPFSEHFAGVRGLAGASILADGQVALILDPITIIQEAK